jgi:hypothetical protein
LPQLERVPALPRLSETSGEARRNRLASHMDRSIQIDGDSFGNFDVPTYLRRRAD